MERLIVARNSPEVYDKLRNARVAVAGLGGLGSHAAISLARTGVGFLKLVDFDIVEPSNLNRQCYNMDQIGIPKSEALKDNILKMVNINQIETAQKFITKENITELFYGFHAIIEAFDNPNTKAMFVETIMDKFPETFLVGASGIAGSYSTELFKMKKLGERCIIIGDFINEAKKGQGLMAPRVATAANIQANLVLRYLLERKYDI